jgi:hypothetical protein
MRRHFLILGLFLASPSLAKSWNGVEPGVTSRDELLKRFGEPSKTVTLDGKEVIAFLGQKAIKGTTQTQFRVDPKTGKVDRIDVFPGPVIEKDTVENNYGPACPAKGQAPATPCYIKRLTDDFRTYFLYPRLGLAVFFNEDGTTVQSFSFQIPKAATASE